MKRSSYVIIIIFGATLSLLCMNMTSQADNLSLGSQAEQTGDLRQALIHYVSALQELWSNKKHSQDLVDKIITLGRELDPPPIVPEEAERHLARGSAAVKAAGSPKDFDNAVKEFETAAYYAPWVAEIYYNLGVVRDKAGKYDAAIWALKMYLQAKPYSEDVKQVKNLIYEIEYRSEKLKEQAQIKISNPAKRFTGKWVGQKEGTYRPNQFDRRAYGKDIFRFEGDGKNINVILLSTQSGNNTSFLGNFANPPIGAIVFQLHLEGSNLTGVYSQPAFNDCNRGKQFPLGGNVIGEGNSLTLNFVEKYTFDVSANDGSKMRCARTSDLGRQPTVLTIKRMD